MSDTTWLTLWLILLIGGLVGMTGLLLMIGGGAIRELKQTLEELQASGEEPGEKRGETRG